eukprot:SAG31_NODE_22498_length_524_cov_1.009412_1_plen_94_part_10
MQQAVERHAPLIRAMTLVSASSMGIIARRCCRIGPRITTFGYSARAARAPRRRARQPRAPEIELGSLPISVCTALLKYTRQYRDGPLQLYENGW